MGEGFAGSVSAPVGDRRGIAGELRYIEYTSEGLCVMRSERLKEQANGGLLLLVIMKAEKVRMRKRKRRRERWDRTTFL